ncbi:serine protease [Labrys miyagiensis]|uniref:Serine protease n=1 Tax=Labrys miyagiensis TaxID=346912 RepID=A0ABQ6CL58_9HYPH|nr:Do family serine endopeptidase [Labrys miyagiensis]GLS20915.1 serine protease [Labrys miyagiensis]
MQLRTFAMAIRMTALIGATIFAPVTAAEDVPPAPPPSQSLAPLVERTAPSVVNIFAQKVIRNRSATRYLDGSAFWRLFRDTLLFGYGQDRFESSLGSGVIVAANGVIVTNYHVVEGASGILVALPGGQAHSAEVLVSDQHTDLAVLRIDAGGAALPSIEFGDSDRLKAGDRVIAIGNPFGLGQTVTSGIVSATARTSFGVGDFRFFIQTDAAINPGNSGGALIAMDGTLVGINTAIYSTSGGSQGLGFAIPSNMARGMVDSAVKGKPLVRPWIGISSRTILPQIAELLGLSSLHGVLVTDVFKGGPADNAGLQQGDVILAVDEFPIDDPQALRYRIATREAGSTVQLTLERGGDFHKVSVSLQRPPNEPPSNDTWMPNLSPLRGARVASLSPAFADEIGVDSGISGIVVLDARVGAGAYRLGLRKGDIIRGIDGRPVRTVDDLLAFRTTPFKSSRVTLERAGSVLTISWN